MGRIRKIGSAHCNYSQILYQFLTFTQNLKRSQYACSTGVCLYFGVAVIKLLSLTSASCYQILKNSEKLKHFEMPRKDALKVIH